MGNEMREELVVTASFFNFLLHHCIYTICPDLPKFHAISKLVFRSEIVTVPEAKADPLGRLKKPFNLGFKAFPGSMLTS